MYVIESCQINVHRGALKAANLYLINQSECSVYEGGKCVCNEVTVAAKNEAARTGTPRSFHSGKRGDSSFPGRWLTYMPCCAPNRAFVEAMLLVVSCH